MAYDYLALVNEVQRRLNEIELTTANFNTARGANAQSRDTYPWHCTVQLSV